jgi:hypothetical protein
LYRVFVRNSTLGKQAADGHLHRPAGKDSGSSAIRAKSQARLREPVAGCRANSLRHFKPHFPKKYLKISGLTAFADLGCVLIVQHTTENHQSEGLRRSSFIACAEAFGNCDVATEGGIPRSSRF